ncbi:MAG: hypothetical protein ACLRWQ_09370 [Flavonifractor plautii]
MEEQRAAAAQAMEEARREATAAAYEVETAQAQQRQHEDAILKLEERLAHFDAQLADASRRRDEQRRELEQIAGPLRPDRGGYRRRPGAH